MSVPLHSHGGTAGLPHRAMEHGRYRDYDIPAGVYRGSSPRKRQLTFSLPLAGSTVIANIWYVSLEFH